MGRKHFHRWLVAACAAGLTMLAAEGVHSLWARRSLLDRLLGAPDSSGAGAPRNERTALHALTPGPYARYADPEVGFHVKPGTTVLLAGVPASTDAYGQRLRPGEPVQPGDVRVLLLGDSVAFGFGVVDEEAPAAQLERLLASASGGATPRSVVSTAASPGWTWRNSFRYLRSHLERLAPDVVLYVAVPNDLEDEKSVDEAGELWIDDAADPSRPQCSEDQLTRLAQTMQHLPSRRTLLAMMQAGGLATIEHALRSGVTTESRRRWEEYLAGIAGLDAELRAHGIAFVVVLPFDMDSERQLELRLALEHPEVRVCGLIAGWGAEDTLGHDAHSNAACVRASAWHMASYLLAEGLVSGDPRLLEEQVPAYRERAYRPVEPERRRAALEELLASKRRSLQPVVDLVDVRGTHQVYGGLLGDGSFGKHVYFALRNDRAERLVVVLERLPAARGLYPLQLAVEVDGTAIGAREVPAPAEGAEALIELEFELPAATRDRGTLDVCLCASSWTERETAVGRRPVSARLRRVELVEP